MTLINNEKLTDEVNEFHKLTLKRSNMSVLKSLLRRPSIDVVRALTKLTNEHENAINTRNLDVNNNHSYFPNEKTQLKLVKVLRKLFDDVYIPFKKSSKYVEDCSISQLCIGGVNADWVKPLKNDSQRVILHIHGGGYVVGNPEIYHPFASRLASMTGVSVILPDYRLAPEHPFPAGLNDCTTVYKSLIESGYDPRNIIISGDSAGGGMTLALVIKLREEGVPLPGGIIPISPYADLTFTGPSMITNTETDIVVADFPLHFFVKCYVDTEKYELDSPLISPYYGNFEGFPPMLLIASESEMLLDDTIRIALKAKMALVKVDVLLAKDMPHVYPCLASTYDWEEVDLSFIKMTQFVLKTLYPREKIQAIVETNF